LWDLFDLGIPKKSLSGARAFPLRNSVRPSMSPKAVQWRELVTYTYTRPPRCEARQAQKLQSSIKPRCACSSRCAGKASRSGHASPPRVCIAARLSTPGQRAPQKAV
jgi:hypothetical protein